MKQKTTKQEESTKTTAKTTTNPQKKTEKLRSFLEATSHLLFHEVTHNHNPYLPTCQGSFLYHFHNLISEQTRLK